MSLLADGHRLMIEIEEHLNDTSGRGSITLGMFHPDPGYTSPPATWGVALGPRRTPRRYRGCWPGRTSAPMTCQTRTWTSSPTRLSAVMMGQFKLTMTTS